MALIPRERKSLKELQERISMEVCSPFSRAAAEGYMEGAKLLGADKHWSKEKNLEPRRSPVLKKLEELLVGLPDRYGYNDLEIIINLYWGCIHSSS